MKGLRKYLTPFAPDQSGAESVLYPLGGMLVILDAGGCTGNICGFDEPRWQAAKSAVFSAGLRDMDAIMGRDKMLVKKIVESCARVKANFVAIIGTPVPAVIATDYSAIRRMLEKQLQLPILTIPSNGMQLYDKGASKAYEALFAAYATESHPVTKGHIGVLGAIPLAMPTTGSAESIRTTLNAQGATKVCLYGVDASLSDVSMASANEKNMVVSPCGLAAAIDLEKRFGTPYEVTYPDCVSLLPDKDFSGKKGLIVQQQVLANSLRDALPGADCQVASWFTMDKESMRADDIFLKEEHEFQALFEKTNYDFIIGDSVLQPMIKHGTPQFIPLPEFAISGKLEI